MMPVGRIQAITAIVMAYAIMLILVSPVVPSLLTTTRSKHALQPPHFVVPVSALLFPAAISTAHTFLQFTEQALLASGSDIVELTSARLC
jgi:hypothetical protein